MACNITWWWWMAKDKSHVCYLKQGNERWNRWRVKYWNLGDNFKDAQENIQYQTPSSIDSQIILKRKHMMR